MPDEMFAGHRIAQIRFTHISGTRTPAALAVRGREFPLELTGTAWIEAETGQVAKLKVGLARDMSDVGLKSLSAEIDYDPVAASRLDPDLSLSLRGHGRGGNLAPALAECSSLHQLQALSGRHLGFGG